MFAGPGYVNIFYAVKCEYIRRGHHLALAYTHGVTLENWEKKPLLCIFKSIDYVKFLNVMIKLLFLKVNMRLSFPKTQRLLLCILKTID